ncbi:DUF421 domain-containing protein [Heliorestis acidaminivorans]|uniref:DUF421 domain-containing protein n=1 Tax=Heliorestis acidaminivorans TaxID=553427 RepID=A0A6I0F4G8_9FIRM|nr:DUF421 domain-containing protein [Heliorestis acidaminivorans]KAB2952100.1 DUF421 domain-containing protein [Heliorestis acidaminivorans]
MPEWLIFLARATAVFLLTLFLVRIMGKRQTSQMTFFDLITAIVIGVLAASFTLNLAGNMTGTFIALLVWTALPLAIYFLSIKFKSVRDVVQGKETILINHGRVLEDKLMEARMTPEDLLSQLRRKNIYKVADVEFAVLEPSGEVSTMLTKAQQPLTPKAMGLQVGQESVPQTVILDGVIMDEALTAMGLNRHWMHEELEKIGVAPENVFIAQVDSVGQVYVDLFDDVVNVPKPKTKELLHAILRKCQADCELYALATKNEKAKQMYTETSKTMTQVVAELEPLLKR